jgi:amino acid adenylation domain-containing protein
LSDQLIHLGFEAWAARRPDALAVVLRDRRVTYGELAARTVTLAAELRASGVGPESVVALCFRRSPEMVVAMLATLLAGAAYLPLEPEHPPERLRRLVADVRPLRLLAGPDVAVDLDLPGRGRGAPPALPAPAGGEHLAYVIHTSGSTGVPRAVAVPHRAVANHLAWLRRRLPLSPDDRVLQLAPYSFDASVTEFFWPLTSGATLVMVPHGMHWNPEEVIATIVREGVTCVRLPPSLLPFVLAERDVQRCRSLRLVVCGGEALTAELRRRWLQVLPWTELHNRYGPTEAAVAVTYERCGSDDEAGPVSLGRPIDGVRMGIVDEDLRPVPRGVTGQIVVAGAALARGYPTAPAATAERFVPCPFGPPGARMLTTGDVGRLAPDGRFEFSGRLDDEIKVRGFRVHPAEVEAALERHEAVARCAVVVCERPPGVQGLAAFVVPRPGAAPGAAELRRFAAAILPPHLVPRSFAEVPGLPLGPNGKLDRSALASST